MFAITGVTGKVGGEMVRALRAAGQPVRAILRDTAKAAPWRALGCEIAVAKMEDAPALARAFAGAEAVFILPPPVFDPEPGYPEARAVIASVVSALSLAQPRKVLCLSTIGADATHDNLLSQRTLMEDALRALPVALTILRPAWFLDNVAWDVAAARATGTIESYLMPLDKPFPMVAAADVGRVAADLIQETWRGVRVVELEGPQRVSVNDLVRALATALHKPVHAVPVPRERWETLFRAQGMKNPGPRMRMLDGFNAGWIAFCDRGHATRKGTLGPDDVVAALVAAPA